MTKSTKLQFSRILISIILIALIAWIISGMDSRYKESKETSMWPMTTGKLLALDTGESCYYISCSYSPKAFYSYLVNKRKYESDRIGVFEPTFQGNSSTEAYLKPYNKNMNEVTVYYNPQDPSQAVLLPGQKSMWRYLIVRILGIAFISFILSLFIMAFINPPEK